MLKNNAMPRFTLRRFFRGHAGCCAAPPQPSHLATAIPVSFSGAGLPLSLVSPGQTVTLVSIHDSSKLRQRAADLGLNIGLTVRVVKNDLHGPLILAVKNDTRLAIARSLAYRIRVQDNTTDPSSSS